MEANKVFTTPCYMAVKDGNHASHLMMALKSIGGRKVYGIPENVTYPCVCGVSIDTVSFGELDHLAGFINCEEREDLFLALASLRDDSDINQWFTDGEKWVLSYIPSLLELEKYFQYIKFDYSKTHKATAEELIKHFNS